MNDKEADEIIKRLKMTKYEIRMEEIESILRHSSPYEPGNYEMMKLRFELDYLKIVTKGKQ